uniref:Uncharacterized protein n=1 Tax=Serinus canaria TaxID=9135 RepID=A0A8C9MPW4_SERCA
SLARVVLGRGHRLALAGADSPEDPKALVQKVQELAQKVTAMTKDAFSRVRESEAAQQARCPRTPALSLAGTSTGTAAPKPPQPEPPPGASLSHCHQSRDAQESG